MRELEVDYRGPDGTVTPIEANASVIETKQGKQIISLCRDITERKWAQEALRLSEERYRTLIEACPDAIVMADAQMRIVFASPQAVRLYGVASEEELCGRPLVSFVADEERPRATAGVASLLERGLRRNSEYTFLRKDGTRFPCEVSSAVVKNDSEQPRAVISIVRDITEHKQAQEALERERRTLQHMLRASDHERQLIAYDIHDGLAQQIARALMQLDVFDHQRTSQPKQAAAAFQAGITMLRQSHFEARRLINGVRPPILDESGVVAAIAHLVHEPRGRKAPEIEFHSKVHFDRLEGVEENAIYRIVQEGITNACKHSKSKQVRVGLLQRDNRVRIEIRDWGVGFNPKALPEQRFGLTGIRERARLLGGKCMIRSKPGDGTAIIVELPVVERSS